MKASYLKIFIVFSLISALGACSRSLEINKKHFENGHLDIKAKGSVKVVAKQVIEYLKNRNLFEKSILSPKGNYYIHQNWVQSASLRYYRLDFDWRTPHLSEWKTMWVITNSGSGHSNIRINTLELVYLGNPRDKVRLPSSPDGFWVETNLDKHRSRLIYNDYQAYKIKKDSRRPLYLPIINLDSPPTSRRELSRNQWIKSPVKLP